MSTIKAVDKLCELVNESNGYVHADAIRLADEIEAETAEMKAFCERVEDAAKAREELEVFGVAYMPLPLDAWGEPIRPDDLMACTAFEPNDFDGKRQVLAVSYGLWVDKDGFEHLASETRHVKPRTLEDVLRDYACDFADSSGPGYDEEVTKRYAEEIRELLGVDDD